MLGKDNQFLHQRQMQTRANNELLTEWK